LIYTMIFISTKRLYTFDITIKPIGSKCGKGVTGSSHSPYIQEFANYLLNFKNREKKKIIQ